MAESQPARVQSSATPPSGPGFLGILAFVGMAVGFGLGLWIFLVPRAVFDESQFRAMAGEGRFDDAEAMLRNHLSHDARDGHGHFLLAQLLLERTDHTDKGVADEDATEALEHLQLAAEAKSRPGSATPATRLLYQGKALHQLDRWEAAEQAWLEALAIEPLVPQAGLSLMDLYYVESRRREERALALRLFKNEPDPHDRAVIMLTLLWADAVRPDATPLVALFERVVRAEPDGIHGRVALGLALIRDSQLQRGIDVLRQAASTFHDWECKQSVGDDQVGVITPSDPKSVLAMEALLAGFDLASRADEVGQSLGGLPKQFASLANFLRFQGLAAQERADWPLAVPAFSAALEWDPTDFESRVRLARALRFVDKPAEADSVDSQIARHREAVKGLLALHDEANALPTIGVERQTGVCERIAQAYSDMERPQEAAAWRELGAGVPRRR